MKSKYEKYYLDTHWYHSQRCRPNYWVYHLKSGGYGRGSFRTQQERRANKSLRYDEDLKELNIHLRVRGHRSDEYLDAWNVEKTATRNWRRSWKEFTRHRKQWMTNLN